METLIKALDRETKQWLPADILESSVLRDVFWVRIYYPNGTILERPRNKTELRYEIWLEDRS